MRYIHPDMWRDEEVVCLHYIVDKPWAGRVGLDGVAGFKGKDGVTHTWYVCLACKTLMWASNTVLVLDPVLQISDTR